MTKLCDMPMVRTSEGPEFPPQLHVIEGRFVIRAIGEGGFSCVDIDWRDVEQFMEAYVRRNGLPGGGCGGCHGADGDVTLDIPNP
jgi:hypothetical protein